MESIDEINSIVKNMFESILAFHDSFYIDSPIVILFGMFKLDIPFLNSEKKFLYSSNKINF